MTIDEIIAYIMQTPENTNSTMLKQMIGQLDTSGSGNSEPLVLHFSSEHAGLDKTWREIQQAIQNGQKVQLEVTDGDGNNIISDLHYMNFITDEDVIYRNSEDLYISGQMYFRGEGFDSLFELTNANSLDVYPTLYDG